MEARPDAMLMIFQFFKAQSQVLIDGTLISSHHGDHGGDWKWHSLCHPICGHQYDQVGTLHRLQQLRLKITFKMNLVWWFLQNLWIVGVADDHWAEDEGGQDDDPCSPEDRDELTDWKTCNSSFNDGLSNNG